MQIVVIGGSGLIGTKVVKKLTEQGHEALAASPNTGVDATTGRGLAEALARAEVVVDVSNSPSFEDAAVLAFFENSSRNLMQAEADVGIRHHVALSVVGADRLPDSGYMRAKVVQEAAIMAAAIPYTIVRATQFMEFLGTIADAGEKDGIINVATGLFQPIAADDVADFVAEVALSAPHNGIIEIAGPERAPFDEFIRNYLGMMRDNRPVHADPEARYFGGKVEQLSLVPLGECRLGQINLADWIKRKIAAGSSPQRRRSHEDDDRRVGAAGLGDSDAGCCP